MNRDRSTTATAIATGTVIEIVIGTGTAIEIVIGTALVHLRLLPALRIDRPRPGEGQHRASRIVDRDPEQGGMEADQTILQRGPAQARDDHLPSFHTTGR
jgi:hypothetical protein